MPWRTLGHVRQNSASLPKGAYLLSISSSPCFPSAEVERLHRSFLPVSQHSSCVPAAPRFPPGSCARLARVNGPGHDVRLLLLHCSSTGAWHVRQSRNAGMDKPCSIHARFVACAGRVTRGLWIISRGARSPTTGAQAWQVTEVALLRPGEGWWEGARQREPCASARAPPTQQSTARRRLAGKKRQAARSGRPPPREGTRMPPYTPIWHTREAAPQQLF